MEPQHTEQDTVHRESRQKLDAARFMKDECAYTRKSLNNYLRGHLFRFQKNRINRHVASCALCKSEVDALKRMEETRQLMKEIELPEGVAHKVKAGVSALGNLKMILYRPLWLACIALAAAALFYYATLPRQVDLELESIAKSFPTGTAAAPPVEQQGQPGVVTAVATTPAVVVQPPAPAPPPAAPVVEPLAVSIIPANETAAIRRINEALRGHGRLRGLKFSKTDRELSGKLAAKDLLAFFERIKEVAKVRYNHKRLESTTDTQPIPFVLTLKAAPSPPPNAARTPLPDQKLIQKNTTTFASTGATVSAPSPTTAQPRDGKTAVPRK